MAFVDSYCYFVFILTLVGRIRQNRNSPMVFLYVLILKPS